MTIFPKGTELINKFIDGITKNTQFALASNNDGTVLRFTFNNHKYVAYFKCISYAGNPYPRNTTRAQLPQRPEFDVILEEERFLFLGYDVVNDLFVCWDPIKVKSRLNKKSYVSFFCRQNIQDSVEEGNIVESHLTNGDMYVLFKRNDIARFFEMIEVHFPKLWDSHTPKKIQSNNISDNTDDDNVSDADPVGRLSEISNDPIVKAYVDQLIAQGKSSMQIISGCCNTFSTTYNTMLFKEWSVIINEYINQNFTPR